MITSPASADRRVFNRASAKPAPFRGLGSEVVRLLSRIYLGLGGWRMQGDWPGLDKAVLIAAPHTSNWDGLNMVAAAGYYRVKLRWMGKKSLTTGPFGWLIKRAGCVPVDRSAAHDMVAQMKAAFAAEKSLVLAIAPEGTRDLVTEWKRGFHHIARGANVPIAISVLDYGAKTISLSGVMSASDDYDADVAWIKEHYVGVKPLYPERWRLG